MSDTIGKKAHEMEAEYQEWADSLLITVSCMFCPDFEASAPASEARRLQAEHRAEVHPERSYRRGKRRSHLLSFRQHGMNSNERDEIYAERRRRAFLTGVELDD